MTTKRKSAPRQWHIQRHLTPLPDGQRRWDRAYQSLLLWSQPVPVTLLAEQMSPATNLNDPNKNQERRCKMTVLAQSHIALYARVSTSHQVEAQTIDQQLERLHNYVKAQGWLLGDAHIYRDDGRSGANLKRPGLDHLRDAARNAEFDHVVITAPDRLARNYVQQMIIVDKLEKLGCKVEFLDRPMNDDPHDRLLLQIRGAVAEYERTLICDRMRRGRQQKYKAGTLLPWSRPPYGYRFNPDRPRDPAGVFFDENEATVVRQIFEWYLEEKVTLQSLAARLQKQGVPTPFNKRLWSTSTLGGILKQPAYTGQV